MQARLYKKVNAGLSMHIVFEPGITEEQEATILTMIKDEQRADNKRLALNSPLYPEIQKVANLMKKDIFRSYKEGKYK